MLYIVSGTVIRGEAYGRKLGFPTANLDVDVKDITSGVYAGKAKINNKKHKIYRAAIIVKEGKAESYLLGFRGDLYDKNLTLTLKKFIRPYKKFQTENELLVQIGKDVKQC